MREIDTQAIVDAYRNGTSRHEIAARFDTHWPRVTRILEAAGVELRDDRNRRGEAHPLFRDGKTITKEGYVRVLVPDGSPYVSMRHASRRTVLEHRLVMAEHLGRPLFPHEVVHHINGDRSDNRFENLELWEVGHPPGQRNGDHARPHCPTCTCHSH